MNMLGHSPAMAAMPAGVWWRTGGRRGVRGLRGTQGSWRKQSTSAYQKMTLSYQPTWVLWSAKAFQHWFALSGWQAYLRPPHGWLGQISGVLCIYAPLSPLQTYHQGWDSHALSFLVMIASDLASYTMSLRSNVHTEWSTGYKWSRFVKKMFVY